MSMYEQCTSSLETPHLPGKIFAAYFESSVYEPAEDTFILLDAIEIDLEIIRKNNPLICLEIGCGSGTVITSVAKALGPNQRIYFGIDINRTALECTRKCSQLNLFDNQLETIALNERPELVQLIQSDLTTSLRLRRCVDLLIFNPPYVPTPDEEIRSGIEATWAGGDGDGRKVIDRFITQTLIPCLSPNGAAYLVVIEQNNPKQMAKQAKEIGFQCTPVITRKCGIETLTVLRFERIV